MSRILFFICIFSLLCFSSVAQDKKAGPLLDGTSVYYVYKTVGGVHVELSNGQFRWHWDSGNTGSAPYQARKIGDKIYLVNFKVAGSSNFVTIVFNFGKKVFYTSAILDPKTQKEQVLFETGPIKELKLKEN
jgi:MoaF N-terminal domain